MSTSAVSSENLELDLPTLAEADEAAFEEKRSRILAGVASGKLDSLQERVAWILNHHPDARDSDITLQLRFWEEFQGDIYDGGDVSREDLYRLARLTSLSRARAKLQNTYHLFIASPEIRGRRGSLGEDERAKAAAQRPDTPLYQVAADESGKNGAHLIWGSVWVLHGPEVSTVLRRVGEWRKARKFDSEFHFKEIDKGTVRHYIAFVDFLETELSSTLTFRSISVENHGLQSDALEQLLYHLLVKGVEQEHTSGRAPLPRRLQLWKDREQLGQDKIMLAGLRERVDLAGRNTFEGQLSTEEFESLESKNAVLVQLADLYAGSLNRVLNMPAGGTGPKDDFARRLLSMLGTPHGPQKAVRAGDMSAHIAL